LTVDKLSKEEAYLLKVLRFLIIKPEFIAIDNILSLVSKTHMDKIFEFIKQNQITMLNVTNDLNESLYGNKLFVLENFVLILEGSTMSVLKTDNLLKRLGFSLPLTVDLSIELIHYDVLDKIYKDKKKLVNALWK
jgi:energy-coupling factor transporter ATP-binding protein EcfA2